MILPITKEEFKSWTKDLTVELETWHDKIEVFGRWFHEADLAEIILSNGEGIVYLKPSYLPEERELGIVVRKEFQGIGNGHRLLRAIEEKAKGKTLVAKVFSKNQACLEMLLHNGWSILEDSSYGFKILTKKI